VPVGTGAAPMEKSAKQVEATKTHGVVMHYSKFRAGRVTRECGKLTASGGSQ
jgi:hypothetical protein